jgi:Mrp family chromosome partitioning ATPase/capsular polysaccharide biosynthesis protein
MPADDVVLTLREYLRPIRIRWWLIVLFVGILAGIGVAYGVTRSKSYEATTKLFIESPASVDSILSGGTVQAGSYVADQATLMTSSLQARRVQKALGYGGAATASQIGVTDFIDLTVTANTAAHADALANEYARQYRLATSKTDKVQANRELRTLRKQYKKLTKFVRSGTTGQNIESEIQQLETLSQEATGVATIVNPASAAPTAANKALEYGVIGGIAGLIASILLAYLLQGMDPRLRGANRTGDVYAFPVLSTVPHDTHIDDSTQGVATFSARSREAFRDLRVALDLTASPAKYRIIAVCSAMPGEGKTSVARGLALAYCEVGRSVVIVDLDLRRARLAERFGLPATPGVSDVVGGVASLDEAKSTIEVSVPAGGKRKTAPAADLPSTVTGFATEFSLTVIPPGSRPANALAVMEDHRLSEIVAELGEEYDVVIVDTAPLVPVSDAIPVLGYADATLIVARSGVTDKRSAKLASTILGRIHDLTVAGVVVNDLNTSEAEGYGSAYSHKYGYA